MKIKETLIEIADGNECLFDDALIGTGYRDGGEVVAVYDIDKCIGSLVKDGMEDEEAEEFFYYNTLNSYVGEKTPLFIHTYKK